MLVKFDRVSLRSRLEREVESRKSRGASTDMGIRRCIVGEEERGDALYKQSKRVRRPCKERGRDHLITARSVAVGPAWQQKVERETQARQEGPDTKLGHSKAADARFGWRRRQLCACGQRDGGVSNGVTPMRCDRANRRDPRGWVTSLQGSGSPARQSKAIQGREQRRRSVNDGKPKGSGS